jgi:hypothetical protein
VQNIASQIPTQEKNCSNEQLFFLRAAWQQVREEA